VAIDGTAIAIAPIAAKINASFFMFVLLHGQKSNIRKRETFLASRKRILNGCSAAIDAQRNPKRWLAIRRSLDNQRVDPPAAMPAHRLTVQGRWGMGSVLHSRQLRPNPPISTRNPVRVGGLRKTRGGRIIPS
jgi:hypothetical protein